MRIGAAGLCHSDLSVINGDRPRPMPMALGHEAAGVVEEIGRGRGGSRQGRPRRHGVRAELRPLPALRGGPARALRTRGGGERCRHAAVRRPPAASRDGTVVHHHLGVLGVRRIRDGVAPLPGQDRSGAAARRGGAVRLRRADRRRRRGQHRQVPAGASVAVIGLGGVGLASLLGAAAAGARRIVAVDLSDEKLGLARQLGATDTVNARDPDAAEQVREATGGGVEFAFEMAGSVRAMELAYKITRRGGTTVTAGLPPPTATLPLPLVNLVARGAHGQGQLHRHLRADPRPAALRRALPAGPAAGGPADERHADARRDQRRASTACTRARRSARSIGF